MYVDNTIKNEVLESTGQGLSEFLNEALIKYKENKIDKSGESAQMIHLKRRLGKMNALIDKQLQQRKQINEMLPLNETEMNNIVDEIKKLKIKERGDKE